MRLQTDKIIQPLVSEKSAKQEKLLNEYSIVVDKRMTKTEILTAVEKIFGAKPIQVRTVNFRKKTKQTRYGAVPAQAFKKAYVRMPEGKRIELK